MASIVNPLLFVSYDTAGRTGEPIKPRGAARWFNLARNPRHAHPCRVCVAPGCSAPAFAGDGQAVKV